MPLNVPLGRGGDFRGVASTLNVPADTAGALVDPAEIHESLIESIIVADEAVMERYFEGTLPTEEELSPADEPGHRRGQPDSDRVRVGARRACGFRNCSTCWRCAACRPTASSRKARKADGEEVEVKADPAGPLVAQVFKTRIDPFVQKLSFIRVFSGTLKKDSTRAGRRACARA